MYLLVLSLVIGSHVCSLSGIRTWIELQREEIVQQAGDWDCGPASVKTLLHWIQQTESLAGEQTPAPSSLADLQAMLAAQGVSSTGYALTWDQLVTYLSAANPTPVIVHTENTEQHFCLLVGTGFSHIVTADPSDGWLGIPKPLMQASWTGYVLYPHLAGDQRPPQHILTRIRDRLHLLVGKGW